MSDHSEILWVIDIITTSIWVTTQKSLGTSALHTLRNFIAFHLHSVPPLLPFRNQAHCLVLSNHSYTLHDVKRTLLLLFKILNFTSTQSLLPLGKHVEIKLWKNCKTKHTSYRCDSSLEWENHFPDWDTRNLTRNFSTEAQLFQLVTIALISEKCLILLESADCDIFVWRYEVYAIVCYVKMRNYSQIINLWMSGTFKG